MKALLVSLLQSEYRDSITDIFGADATVQSLFESDRRIGGLLSASRPT